MRPFLFNAFQLKMIAIIAMLVDHVGAVFFPHILVFRVIGRLTAPIMAFFIAEGYTKTHNVRKYELRLFIFAIISMLPYYLVFGHSPFNILFDLFLGLLVIAFSQRLDKDYQKWCIVLMAAIIAICLQTDGRFGISTLVYLFFYFRGDKKSMGWAAAIMYLGSTVVYALYAITTGEVSLLSQTAIWLRPLSLLALPFLFRYNGERGRSLKYFFYSFYPVHLIIICILMRLL